MQFTEIKNILNDRINVAYIVSFSILAVFAYILLVKCDISNLYRLNTVFQETNLSLQTLKRMNDYKAYTSKFDSTFVSAKGTNWLIEIITELSKKEGVALELLKPAESRTIAGYKIIMVTAEGTAAYPNMVRFLNRLENFEKRLFIEEIGFSVEKGPAVPSGQSASFGAGPLDAYPSVDYVKLPSPEQNAPPPANIGVSKEGIAKFRIDIASFSGEK